MTEPRMLTTENESIDRREAVRRVTVFLGGIAFVGGSRLLHASEDDGHARAALLAESGQGVGAFTAADIAFLDEVAETIVPATSTPGAKAAKVGAFMALMVTDTYDPRDQQIFRDGMRTIDEESRKASGVAFMKATPRQRLALLERLDGEQKAHMDAREIAQQARAKDSERKAETVDSPAHYFRMMKELTLLGYFTSEIGCTQAQRYVESPGRFEPCLPYKRGERSWASHA
jgi:limonene-1,2-epoxide hydrolase